SGTQPANISPLTFQYFHDHAQSFSGFAVTSTTTNNSSTTAFAERIRGERGTADFFKVIGVQPAIGRGYAPEECAPAGPAVAVISYGLWQRAFAGASDVIGKQILLGDRPFTVIGVMPSGFHYEPAVDMWTPLQLRIDPRDRGLNYAVVTRLKDGVTME